LELRSHRLPRSRRPDSMQPRPAWADTGAEAFGTMPCRLSVIVTLDTRHPSTAISAPTCQVGWSKVLPSITRLETAWEGESGSTLTPSKADPRKVLPRT